MIYRSKAPVRIGLAGGGTDVSPYCDQYGGCVLNQTIDMYAYCTIEPTWDGQIVFHAADRKELVSLKSVTSIELTGDLLLHKGVYNNIVKQYNNNKPLSFKMTTYSDAPAGSGLGSSSTMVVAMIKAYAEWLNIPLGEYDIASLAYHIEREEIGYSGGKQDQYAATFGGLNFIEFFSDNRVIVNPLRIKNWIKNELENSLILFFTGTSRDSAKIIDQQIKSIQDNINNNVQGMHELKASAYTMKEAILKGDFELFTKCLNKGWESKKKTSQAVSNEYLDEIYEYAMKHGAKAAKVSGAGGGGFMMIFCDPLKRPELIEALNKTKGQVVLAKFVEQGTQSWYLAGE